MEPLTKGFSETGFDSQNVFDTDHSVADADGTVASVSNVQAGREPPWVLLDTSRQVRPVIWPEREVCDSQSMTDPTNPHVLINGDNLYGVVRARVHGCAGARAAMMSLRSDGRTFDLANPEAVVQVFNAGGVDLPVDYEHQSERADCDGKLGFNAG